MKKIFFGLFAGTFILALTITGTTYAQASGKVFRVVELTTLETTDPGNEDIPYVNAKVVRGFIKDFSNASNPRWYELDKKFLVKFTLEGRETSALFDKKGFQLYCISYGFEKDLPAEVRRMVKSNYIDHNITRAIEINADNKTAWIVKLEDQNTIISVKVMNKEMEETEHYRKSK